MWNRHLVAILTSQYLKVFDMVRHKTLSVIRPMKSGCGYIPPCLRIIQLLQLCRSFADRGESFIFAMNQIAQSLPHEAFKLTQTAPVMPSGIHIVSSSAQILIAIHCYELCPLHLCCYVPAGHHSLTMPLF